MNLMQLFKIILNLMLKYGPRAEVIITPKKGSGYSSFIVKDNIEESGWIEITQD